MYYISAFKIYVKRVTEKKILFSNLLFFLEKSTVQRLTSYLISLTLAYIKTNAFTF